MTLPLGLGKFQICICSGCGRDATLQVMTTTEDPQYFLGVCGEHEQQALQVKEALERGSSPEELSGVSIQQLFVSPAGRSTKCKYLHWIAPTPTAPPVQKLQKMPKAPTACANWTWEVRPNRWMTLKGESVKLRSLSNQEFISSCIEVRRLNYKRATTATSWIDQLVPPNVLCQYDADKLEVGSSEAYWKLSEFKEEATARGLL